MIKRFGKRETKQWRREKKWLHVLNTVVELGMRARAWRERKRRGWLMMIFFFCFLLSCKAILQFHDMKNTIFLHVNTSTVLSTHVCLNNICHVPIRLDLHLGRENEKKAEEERRVQREQQKYFFYI